MEFKEYIKIVKRRIYLIVACSILIGAFTAYVSYVKLPNEYQANVKLIVNRSTPLEDYKLDINEVNTNIRLINTYKEIMKTRAIMDKVVTQYPELHINSDQLLSNFTVSSVNDTQVMTISVRDQTYKRAADIANAISIVFQSEIVSIYKVDNVIILSDANPADKAAPVTPNPVKNTFLAFIVSMIALTGIVFILHYLDDTVKTERDVMDTLGLTTFAAVAKAKNRDFKSPRDNNKNRPIGEAPVATVNQ
ncbi:YveK family protein [Paenibacillus glycinis]|uniref:Polysaccharide chain length determinant N-terminal domain-containing protein n=1 Tax=Paenibacillus glycinis TaxID=2697035 RepID=A0ABW9XLY7_9BACL|nr:Wzz/FepE/Etk N-terminal domain-containing protein [Paenibacillus glycinis]NBD23612.1 hypothetical protein [Paenibacillus glycinis]